MTDPAPASGRRPPAVRLERNYALLIVGDALGKLAGVFAFGHLGRVVGTSADGRFEVAFNVLMLCTLIIEAGIGPFGARAVAREPLEAPRLMARLGILRGGLVVISAIVCWIFASSGSLPPESSRLLLLYPLVLLPRTALLEWLFQGRDEMGVFVLGNLVEQATLVAGIFAFVHGPDDLLRVPAVQAVAVVFVVILHRVIARRKIGPADWRGAFAAAPALARAVLPIGLSTVAWAARFFMPPIALGLAAPAADHGAFTAAHRLTVSMHSVVWLYFFNLLPTWSRAARDDQAHGGQRLAASLRRSTGWSLGGAGLCVLAVALLGPLVIRVIYGDRFAATPALWQVTAIVPAVAWLSGNFRFGLIARGRMHDEFLANLVGALAGLAGYLWCGAALDAPAAARIFVGAEVVTWITAALMWWRASRIGSADRSTTAPQPG